ncbi:MAG TPA: antibiotic biosynthesis monooxygenase [Allosphingosinicella sp.]
MGEFAVIYRWRVEPEAEAAFRKRWHEGTERLKELGGLGSCLCREADSTFLAFARWPSEETRAAAFGGSAPSEWPGVTYLGETKLLVEDDLLIGPRR